MGLLGRPADLVGHAAGATLVLDLLSGSEARDRAPWPCATWPDGPAVTGACVRDQFRQADGVTGRRRHWEEMGVRGSGPLFGTDQISRCRAYAAELRAMPAIVELLDCIKVSFCVASSRDPEKLKLGLALQASRSYGFPGGRPPGPRLFQGRLSLDLRAAADRKVPVCSLDDSC